MSKHLLWLVLGATLLIVVACNSRPTTDDAPGANGAAADLDLQGPDLFEEVTARSGVNYAYRNGEEKTHLAILESLGGGVALIDYDGDGLLDLFVCGGGYFDRTDAEYKKDPTRTPRILGHPCKLYRNLGGFKFQDVTKEVGLDRLAGGQPWFYSHGVAVADYDRDGWPDLLVTGWGRVALFRNVPVDPADPKKGRRFVDVSKEAGLDTGITWATSAAWADLDGDGWPDLYVCQYVNWSWGNHPTHKYDGKTYDVPPPKVFDGLMHKVYRNAPVEPNDPSKGRRFVDVSKEAGLDRGGKGGKGLGVIAVDVNLDGKPDVYVANDTVDNFLYMNRSTPGTIRFEEIGLLAGVAREGSGSATGSMGLGVGDPEGSGLPWLWVTCYENELHSLYRNVSDKKRVCFLYYTPASGIAAIGQKYVGWGTGFLDLDQHGWEDLFIANGHAIRYPTGTTRSQKPVLLRNRNGKFTDITPRGGPYFHKPHLARGVALGDLDNDGKIDLVVSHMNEPVAILRNVARERNHWLGVRLVRADHADFVGARVILEAGGRKQTRFATGGGSYASSSDRRLVFGLGKTERIDKLVVFWPDGLRQEWTGLAPDRYHDLVQGEKEAREVRAGK
jgi:hypothetical protein